MITRLYTQTLAAGSPMNPAAAAAVAARRTSSTLRAMLAVLEDGCEGGHKIGLRSWERVSSQGPESPQAAVRGAAADSGQRHSTAILWLLWHELHLWEYGNLRFISRHPERRCF